MDQRKRVTYLIFSMAVVAYLVAQTTTILLYRAAINTQRARLTEAAQSQARMIETLVKDKVDRGLPLEKAKAEVIQLFIESHTLYQQSAQTGEFTLAYLDGDQIVFLMSHQRTGDRVPDPVPLDSDLAEPQRRALAGESGTVIALDYSGRRVLGAYEPLVGLDMGVVAKVDMSEILTPFLNASLYSLIALIIGVTAGAFSFIKITRPMIDNLEQSLETATQAQRSMREYQESLKAMTHRLIYIQEEERNRVSKDFHDVSGQVLSALKIYINILGKKVAYQNPQLVGDVDKIREYVDMVTEQLRIQATALRPTEIEIAGLSIAVGNLCETIGGKYEGEINFQTEEIPPIDDTASIFLYRVVQEALKNIIRHANASKIDVSIAQKNGSLLITIQDDGKGFSVENTLTKPTSLGLMGMVERMVSVGGTLEIVSVPGDGTQITAIYPLPELPETD